MAKTRFTTPVGRLVQGDLDEPQTKDAQGNLRVVKTGPNAGQPNPQYFCAVAFPKADPHGEFAALWGQMQKQAAQDFPNLFPNAQTGDFTCAHPNFSFKMIDGDGRDSNGKSNAEKEGFAEHWVLRFASSYPPRLFHAGRYAAHEQIQEKGAIKRGYFVRVNGAMDGNGNAQRPGLYLNLDMVELSAYGPEIVSGPSADEAFSGGPANLPQGASATPVGGPPATPGAPSAGPTPATPGAPPSAAPAPAPTTAPAPVPTGAPASPAGAPPYGGYMAPTANPTAPGGAAPAASPAAPAASTPSLPTASPASPAPAPAAPAPTPAPAAPVAGTLTEKAQGATYEALIAAGWTDATLREHGLMV